MRTGVTYGQPTIDRVVSDLQQLLSALARVPWLEGRLFENVTLEAGDTEIRHGLGRTPKGWWVVMFSGAAASDYPRQKNATSSVLTLTVTNAAVASLWVF